jgi:hypothetical protein
VGCWVVHDYYRLVSKRKLQNLLLEFKPADTSHTLLITTLEETHGTKSTLIVLPLMGKEDCDKTGCI